ncbi:hypothetical protein IAR50_002832 [Cryptococcus sp. DSM 104548]
MGDIEHPRDLEGTSAWPQIPSPPTIVAPTPLPSPQPAQAPVSHQPHSVAPKQHGPENLPNSQRDQYDKKPAHNAHSDEVWHARGLVVSRAGGGGSFRCIPCSQTKGFDFTVPRKGASHHTRSTRHLRGLPAYLEQEGKKVETDVRNVERTLRESMKKGKGGMDWMKQFAKRINEVMDDRSTWLSTTQRHLDSQNFIYYHCSTCFIKTASSPHVEIAVGLLIRHLREAEHAQRVSARNVHVVDFWVPPKSAYGSPDSSIPASLPQPTSVGVPSLSAYMDMSVPGNGSLDIANDTPIDFGDLADPQSSDTTKQDQSGAPSSSLPPLPSLVPMTPKSPLSLSLTKSLTHSMPQRLKRPPPASSSDWETTRQQRPRLNTPPSSGDSWCVVARPSPLVECAGEGVIAKVDLMLKEGEVSSLGKFDRQRSGTARHYIREIKRCGEELMAAFEQLREGDQ